MHRVKFGPFAFAVLAGWVILAGAAPEARARGKKLVWKPVIAALLKLNNHPVKTWNVLQPDKNRNLVLVEVSKDWYVLDLKRKRAYKVEGRDYATRGENLVGPEPDERTPTVKTDGWDSHDIGPAQQVTIRFAATGNVLAIELPHPLAIY
jgi:hypothetical protein